LCFEVLLARVFAISQWNHMVFMVISIALLGFAAAGTFLSLAQSKSGKVHSGPLSIELILSVCLIYPVVASLSFIIINRLPLDYFRLPLMPVQIFYLLTTYVLLVVPFFLTGLVVSSAYSMIPERTGIAYFVSMLGSAGGAALPALCLPYISEGRLIILTAALPLLIVIPSLRLPSSTNHQQLGPLLGNKKTFIITVVIGGAAILLLTTASNLLSIQFSPYKAVAQTLQLPDSQVVETRNHLTGRTTVVSSPHVRFVPGLSLKFSGEIPEQNAIFRDGDNQLVLYDKNVLQKDRFAAFTLSSAAYRLVEHPTSVLIVQNGGGLAIACARVTGIPHITVIEPHTEMARIVAEHYPFVTVKTITARQFFQLSTDKYDIIHIENWGTSLPGTTTLNQEYLLTVDALKVYLEHLSEKGVISLSRRLLLPPSDMLRLWATVTEALRKTGIEHTEDHVAVLRSWDTYVMLISRQALDTSISLSDFAEGLNFDWVYRPNHSIGWTNRYYVFDSPYHSEAINRLNAALRVNRENVFYDAYMLDVSPQSDDRPFPYRFLKWHRLTDLYRTTGNRTHSLLLSGEIVISVVFMAAVFLSTTLLGIPVLKHRVSGRRPKMASIVYFLSVGAGFMLVELYFIKRMVLLFGDPVVSFTVILTGMLVFSGIGGFLSQRMTGKLLSVVLTILLGLLVLTGPVTDRVIEMALARPPVIRYMVALTWLVVPGVVVGMPFPLAMRHCLVTPMDRAYAWTANGCTSVLASIVAAQVAISLGITAILVGATMAYGAALASALIMRKSV
jgi:predicted membrane-bound spermidine synthase